MEADYRSPLAAVARHQAEPPVDLAGMAHDLQIHVYYANLASHIAGQIMRDAVRGGKSGYAIFINIADHPNRQRFTLAHEISHFILHRDLIENGIVDDTMYRSNISSHYEAQANRMAADILMPVLLVRKYFTPNLTAEHLAQIFRVSPGAMKIRLEGMGIRTPQV